ncbi:MAG TPA: hypothetical protein VK806_08295 [Bacteroidia bacterium]|jgi:hypothetical protein|nr:hypothetical protein [Bacteroidia bacterium]
MKNKIVLFVFGLLAGIAIGVVFDVGIKAVFRQIRELHLSLNKIGVQQSQISQRLDSIQGKLKDNKKGAVITKGDIKTIMPVVQKDNAIAKDTLTNGPGNADSLIAEKEQSDSNIVVMTNQLITVSSLPVKNIDSVSSNKSNARSDSMLASMTNTSEEEDPSVYRVEFWQSPLNFKGYKMSIGKLVLYGINSTGHVALVKSDDGYYLLANQSAYKVMYTDDFKPFERVTDRMVLKKLSL